jgi:hypothetical protein
MESKSSVLVFVFHFLPYFFYCRLIVACIVDTEWKIHEDGGVPCLYKDVALFSYKYHLIVLVVTKSAIQVQLFHLQNAPIDPDIGANIKASVESRLHYLAKTFHKNIIFRIAFQCSKQNVLSDDVNQYVYQEDIPEEGIVPCPKHGFTERHGLNIDDLTMFWKPVSFFYTHCILIK